MKKLKQLLCAGIAMGTSIPALANEASAVYSLTLTELLDVKLNIASNIARPIREQSGVISYIDQSDIANSGARDLLDVLKLVPGFNMNIDLFSSIDLSFRGMRGRQGKIQLIIDDVLYNELSYSSFEIGHRFPANIIEQIEIIRGPGSVIYGDAAELAVIKVTTKNKHTYGSEAHLTVDARDDGLSNHSYSLITGGNAGDWHYGVTASLINNKRADIEYVTQIGTSYDAADNSDVSSTFLMAHLSNGNTEINFSYNNWQYEDRSIGGGLGMFLPPPPFPNPPLTDNLDYKLEAINLTASHTWQITEKLSLDNKLSLFKQEPYSLTTSDGAENNFDNERYLVEIKGHYDISQRTNLLVGISWQQDVEEYVSPFPGSPFSKETFYDGHSVGSDHSDALFFQVESNLQAAVLTLGGRYEKRKHLDEDSFVPRLSLTRVWDKAHAKLMYDEAFRFPSINGIATAKIIAGVDDLVPEKARHLEMEWGYLFTDDILFQTNIYSQKILDVIAYNPELFTAVNSGDINTIGAEFSIRVLKPWGDVKAAFATSRLRRLDIPVLMVEGDDNAIFAQPENKLSLNATYNISQQITVNLSGTVVGERYACISDPAFACANPSKLDAEYDFNLFVRKQFNAASIGFGITNILDEKVMYPQAFKDRMAPFPGLGRRALFNLKYLF